MAKIKIKRCSKCGKNTPHLRQWKPIVEHPVGRAFVAIITLGMMEIGTDCKWYCTKCYNEY